MGLFFKLACADNKKSSKLSLLSNLHGHSNVVFEFKSWKAPRSPCWHQLQVRCENTLPLGFINHNRFDDFSLLSHLNKECFRMIKFSFFIFFSEN